MHLFGIAHQPQYFSSQIAVIDPVARGKVLLLELAPNYRTLVQQGILQPNFFMSIEDYFVPLCPRIIHGDQQLIIPEKPDFLLAAFLGEDYYYPNNRRDEILQKAIAEQQPEVVIVGNGHSDDIKRKFPDTQYTVFEEAGGYTVGHHGRPHQWQKPNQIIRLEKNTQITITKDAAPSINGAD